MRILHTADWHVGKKLGRYDRMDDHAAVLDELVELADAEAVDLVLVAGDLFDRSHAPIEALRLVLDTLERLARPERPVVAIAGNHDSPELFELLAPLMRERNVHLRGTIRSPRDGGVLQLAAGGERALVACLPFLREGRAVDFADDVEAWGRAYARKIGALVAHFGAFLDPANPAGTASAGAVRLLMAHFTVAGVRLGGHGLPRGERALHLGEAYTAPGDALTAGPSYVALGHIHAPQPAPGAGVPALYAGSPLELDFGEAGEEKRAVLVEAETDGRLELRSIPLVRGRRLRRARGAFRELVERPDLRDAYVDLTVVTDGRDPGLAERAREAFPHLVRVRADTGDVAEVVPPRSDRPWDELYRDYHRGAHGTEAPAELVEAFNEIHAAVSDAST